MYQGKVPEVQLWSAVIHRAIWDIEFYMQSRHISLYKYSNAKSAIAWIESTNEYPRSFSWASEIVFGNNATDIMDVIRKKFIPNPLPKPEVIQIANF